MTQTVTGTTVRTTCPYCGVGCGVLANATADGTVAITGDPAHPANRGRLCSKGTALGETLDLDGRLLHPEIAGKRVSWDEATRAVADTFSRTIAEHGPDAVAFYVSGQILTEDYAIANKLMKGFIGTANIDTNSRLCMASSVAGHTRAFGTDTVPGCYEDLEEADLVVLVGSNTAWCHPVLFQRLMAARDARANLAIVVIDPRRTATATFADLHLPLAPGSDVALFNGLLAHLHDAGALDQDYIAAHTEGFEAALEQAHETGLEGACALTGLDAPALRRFYDLFARTERVVTVYSQGVNQSTSGSDKVNAILNCHLATGRIGRPGMGPFSVTGQPNAMGGREVGGLANQLACHMELENPAHRAIVQSVWRAPVIADKPGLKAVDMFRAVADGRIRAIWIMGTNPVDSLPEADLVRRALEACPFVVVSDVMHDTDTTQVADVLLPAAGWGEKDGTVTNSARQISRQRAFLAPAGEARPDWRIIRDVAHAMGFEEAFDYAGPADIFREHARLSTEKNDGTRDFDIGACADITNDAYATLEPFQWPRPAGRSDGAPTRFFAQGGFYTPRRRARFIATPPKQSASTPNDAFPLVLNTGRIRDHWHTMTRTAKSPRLSRHIAEPFIEIHPKDAEYFDIRPASLVRVANRYGAAVVRALVSNAARPGAVFVPFHWAGQWAANARINALVTGHTDPVSGQPETKSAAVSIRPFEAAWHGFAIVSDKPAKIEADYWALAKTEVGWRVELAGTDTPQDWQARARGLLGLPGEGNDHCNTDIVSFSDARAGRHRFAAFAGGRVVAALFIDREPVAVSRNWAIEHIQTGGNRLALLAGRPGADMPDPGAIVCSCFSIGVNQICDLITSGRATNVAEVGAVLKAGTNCGSCRSEIRSLIDDARLPQAM
ncbi:assimilatory nitrate reductase (NADH) alpha subunit apoprotein [Breoghania corrubedonensis]|uniref:nitrate reductase (cytochrome) n=1 Tax=Breoghania corrubedonensis TaxID=665038 RepID=A0A2T5VHG5_9HYPH|nr:nitrate reductase [Breoghania corrubedonensis]PTW63200.1 assimilatory nitrate reductase (NADH) alpha subunit apoprotein [Breoghania corrubedonensis]